MILFGLFAFTSTLGLVGLFISAIFDGSTKESHLPAALITTAIFGLLFWVSVRPIWLRWKASKIQKIRSTALNQQGLAIIESLKSGNFQPMKPQNTLLRAGEVALIAVPAALLENKTVGYTSGGSSVRVRIAKGVSIGQYAGRSHAIKGMVRTSVGEFVITQHRVAFAGNKKSFEMPLATLINVEHYKDGIGLHSGRVNHLVVFDGDELAMAAALILQFTLEGKFTVEKGTQPATA